MITVQDYNELADVVYHTDPMKEPNLDKQIKIGSKINTKTQSFIVLDVVGNSDNPNYNGMQAMAIAPVVNGVPDKTRITIVYAGTNMGDKKDIITDIKNVILGKKKYVYTELEGTNLVEKPYSTQIDTALSFADEIKARHPNATIDVTGHSLGGFLALIVSVKNR